VSGGTLHIMRAHGATKALLWHCAAVRAPLSVVYTIVLGSHMTRSRATWLVSCAGSAASSSALQD
jgi:hypothetical protein